MVALIAAGAPVLLVGIVQSQSADDVLSSLRVVGVGALLVFFGVIVLLATFARPLAGALGLPVRAVTGVTGAIARGNAMRNPRRTAATASALVIGLALVEMVAIFGESAKASVRSSDDELRADLVIDTHAVHRVLARGRHAHGRAARGRRRGRLPIRIRPARHHGGRRRRAGRGDERHRARGRGRPADAGGRRADIGDDGMLIFAEEAQLYGLSVGDRMPLRFPERQIDVRVAGIYGQDDLFFGSPFVISSTLFRQGFAEADLDYRAYATAASGVEVDTARNGRGRRVA